MPCSRKNKKCGVFRTPHLFATSFKVQTQISIRFCVTVMASSALKHLVGCAQAIRDGNLKRADSLLKLIWNLADDESDELQSEVVRYFAEALVRRAYGLHSAAPYVNLHLPFLSYHASLFAEIVRDAIIKAATGKKPATGKKQLHIIALDISGNLEIEDFFSDLLIGHGNFMSVRISLILSTILEKTTFIQNKLLKRLMQENWKIVCAKGLGEVDASTLDFRRTKDEAVVICYCFKLHELLAETGALEREFSKLRDINPETVIIAEQDADHNNSDFIKRLEDSFQYYSNACCRSAFDEWRNGYRRQIHNIIGCEGRDRIVRHQTLVQWQSHFQSAGFLSFPLELFEYGASGANYRIQEHNGSAVVTVNNCPFFFVSAWKLTDEESHLNQTNNNFVEGFNPSPLLENRVQPFQFFPEGFWLNQFAALTEIYDMLEEILFTYKLQWAFTWVRGPNVNEKRSLFIQSTFCLCGTFFRKLLLKKCEKQQLLEGQAVAGKALQSNEDFHFESSVAMLKKRDQPFAEIYEHIWDSVAMAICLRNSYTMDVDYVVEFFVPTFGREPKNEKSLAFHILNDLKNMKKVFVTVGVRGTEVQFQEKDISNIPQMTMPTRNPPPASSTNYLLHSNTRGGQETKKQVLNEQGGVIANFRSPLSMHASSTTANNGILEIPRPHGEGNGRRISLETLVNNENEAVRADGNNLFTSSAKRRKLRSDVWEEFTKKEDEDGKVRALCTHCNRKFDGSSTKGTTHLRNHLERCKSRPTKGRDQQLTFPVGIGDSKNERVSEGNSSFDQCRSDLKFARMIIKKQWPLNIVEDEFFSSFLKEVQPMFKIQSQEALSSDIVCVYKEEKHKLLEYFGKLSCRFNLIISLWAYDLEKTFYCCYTVQFIDDNWELQKKILALKSLGNQFDKRIFYENFKNFLVDWNFDKRVCSVTMYNSSSCLEIVEEIRSWHFFEASHPSRTFFFSSDQCIRGLLCKDNSSENVGKSMNGAIRTSNACLLDIFNAYKKLGQQEGRGYPLINVKTDNDWKTCSMVLAIAAVLDPRFRFHFVKFSYSTIYGNGAAKIHLTMIREALTDIFNEYASNMVNGTKSFFTDTNCSTLLNAEENTMESFHRWYNCEMNVNTEASRVSELDKYLHQRIIIPSNSEFDVLGWWCKQASNFPILGRMVRDILAIPLSSIISGSTFNEKAMMDNPIFRGLDLQIIEAMICSRDWLDSPKGISNVEPNKRSGNVGIPTLRLEDSSAPTHHLGIEHFFSESDNEVPGNEDLGKEATTWTEKDVQAYLVSPFTDEELEHLEKWKNHAISGKNVELDKIQGNALAPLLKIPPLNDDLKDPQNYYIEDTVVNQFFILLKRRYEKFPHKYLKHHSIDSFSAHFLIERLKTESEVLSWVNQEDLKGARKLFLPICLREHWLLFVADIADKKLLWLDSNEHSRMFNVLEKNIIQQWFLKLLSSMGHDHKNWSFDVPKDIPQQKNSVDCALFVMKYADCLTHGNYFPFTQDDMPHFRHRTFLDLYHGSICSGRSQDDRANHGPLQNKAKSKRKIDEKESTYLVKVSNKWNSEEIKSPGDNAKDYNIKDDSLSFDFLLEYAGEKVDCMESF